MTRIFIVGLGVLLLGCTSQEEYLFIAHFHNVCSSPVQITAHHYTNVHEPLETAVLNAEAKVDERVLVLNTWGFSKSSEYGIPPTYKLELSINKKQQNFDRNSFLAILKKSKHKFDGRHHLWTINDPSLCP
jgi:hypothetical protein